MPWNLGLFSMKETPLPLMVCAMIAVGLPFVASAFANAPANRGEAVAVDLDACASRSAPLVGQRLEVHDVLHEPIELDPVVVHDRDQVVDLVERPEHRRFPDLAFLDSPSPSTT